MTECVCAWCDGVWCKCVCVCVRLCSALFLDIIAKQHTLTALIHLLTVSGRWLETAIAKTIAKTIATRTVF